MTIIDEQLRKLSSVMELIAKEKFNALQTQISDFDKRLQQHSQSQVLAAAELRSELSRVAHGHTDANARIERVEGVLASQIVELRKNISDVRNESRAENERLSRWLKELQEPLQIALTTSRSAESFSKVHLFLPVVTVSVFFFFFHCVCL